MVNGSLLLVLGLCLGPHLTYFHIEIYIVFFNIMDVSQLHWSSFFNEQSALRFENACKSIIFV